MSSTNEHFERAKAHFLTGLDHLEHGRWALAEIEFRASLRWVSDRPSTWANLGACLIRQEKWDQATHAVTQALQRDEMHAPSWLNQGLIAAARQDFAQALVSYDRALVLEPNDAKAWSNKGLALSELGRFAEAGACLDRALQLDANNPEYWSNRAISWAEQGQFEAALHDHAQAVALAPQDAGGHYNQALLWLRLKQFEPGFEAYEWRWELEHFSSPRLNTSVPLWRGPGHGRQVLLWSEQGLGDEVLYASMVSLLKADQGCFTLSADQRLVPALQKGMSHIQVVSHTQAQQMLVQGLFDAQAPSGSLGRLLRVDESKLKARSMPYLQADEQRLQSMQKQLAARRTGPVCGVSWRSKSQLIGAGKSIDLPLWSDVWRTPGWSFVNLQYGDTRHEREALQQSTGVHIGHIEGLDLFNDLQGLLALIQSCDCVITTSNVTAHLAGALGKKALVLVPHGKSKIWYWHDDDDFSMWYPALKLIHQAHPGAWEPEMQQAADWLTRAKF